MASTWPRRWSEPSRKEMMASHAAASDDDNDDNNDDDDDDFWSEKSFVFIIFL